MGMTGQPRSSVRARLLWRTAALAAVLAGMAAVCMHTAAAPYQNYTYDIHGEPNAEPQAFVPVEVISGQKIGLDSFLGPQDIVTAEDGSLYLADTGNNRLVVIGKDRTAKAVISRFVWQGEEQAFNQPSGLFVTAQGSLYVADTGNARIVVFNRDFQCVDIIGEPSDGGGAFSYQYAPIGVAVDFAGRVFVVSRNCSDGILQFDKDGNYFGAFGAIKTNPSLSYLFWKSLASEEQKKQMDLVIPTEYSGIDVDAQGFVYGTVSAIDSAHYQTNMFIHRLNPLGVDVLGRSGFSDPMGDVKVEIDKENDTLNISRLVDVSVMDYGFYAVLDSSKGRVFTYNRDGKLLYLFGALGEEKGQFGNPVALDTDNNGLYYVLYNKYNQVVVFQATEYASLIHDAFAAHYNRDYETAEGLWFQTLKYTSKSDLVFNEIGKLYTEMGEYEKAMDYLEMSNDRAGYSDALQFYRSDLLARYFGTAILVIAAAIAAGILLARLYGRRKRRGGSA